jgi:hypothetical protein
VRYSDLILPLVEDILCSCYRAVRWSYLPLVEDIQCSCYRAVRWSHPTLGWGYSMQLLSCSTVISFHPWLRIFSAVAIVQYCELISRWRRMWPQCSPSCS